MTPLDNLNLIAVLNNSNKFVEKYMKNTEKPPIGLRPEYIFKMQYKADRLLEIVEAMNRYKNVGKEIPNKWRVELHNILHS